MNVLLKSKERIDNDPRIKVGSNEVYPVLDNGWIHISQYGAKVELKDESSIADMPYISKSNIDCNYCRGYGFVHDLLIEERI